MPRQFLTRPTCSSVITKGLRIAEKGGDCPSRKGMQSRGCDIARWVRIGHLRVYVGDHLGADTKCEDLSSSVTSIDEGI